MSRTQLRNDLLSAITERSLADTQRVLHGVIKAIEEQDERLDEIESQLATHTHEYCYTAPGPHTAMTSAAHE